VAALESRRLKELKQHSGLGEKQREGGKTEEDEEKEEGQQKERTGETNGGEKG
jgi:hypothetical protein